MRMMKNRNKRLQEPSSMIWSSTSTRGSSATRSTQLALWYPDSMLHSVSQLNSSLWMWSLRELDSRNTSVTRELSFLAEWITSRLTRKQEKSTSKMTLAFTFSTNAQCKTWGILRMNSWKLVLSTFPSTSTSLTQSARELIPLWIE